MKVCRRCKIDKPDSEFRIRVEENCNYLNATCINCDSLLAKQYYDKHKNDETFKQKNRDRAKAYCEKNIDKIKMRRASSEYLKKHAAWNLQSYYRGRDLINARQKVKRETDKYKKYVKEYRQRNKEKIHQQEIICKRRYHEKHRDNITDRYAFNLLRTQKVVSKIESTPKELIEIKKTEVIISRIKQILKPNLCQQK